MIKKLFSFLLAFVGMSALYADGLPEVSTDGNETWYLIQFGNGGSVFEAARDNANLTNGTASGEDAQLWKFTGDNQSGYTLTNKLGYVMCSPNGNQNTMVKAAKRPTGTQKFKIVPTKHGDYKGFFEINPMGNPNVSMNLFGGPGSNQGVGYWSNSSPDANNCVKFLSEKEFLSIGKYAIIPYPRTLNELKEGSLPLNTLKRISCPNDSMLPHLQEFADQLKRTAGVALEVVGGEAAAENGICLTVDSHLAPEAYTLKVNDNGVSIQASRFAGFFYALQTLKQLLPNAYFEKEANADVAWGLPFVEIADEPELAHRGFMLDVARHYFDKREVMRMIDMMALYKMNIFHWHLTEDQGWRIEIPEYPLLTEVGSIRKGSFSNPGVNGAFYDDTEYGRGMWYSQEDLKEVVAYASARNIDIIPEVDFPGHMLAAIAAYPELSCDPSKTYEVRVASGISKDVLNIGNDKVIDFLKTIMDNLVKIFPYRYIHFGGDECPTDQWRTNEQCLQRVKDKGLKGVEELQSWLIEELGTYVKTKYNRDIMVWDELVAHWNTKNKIKPVVMCWHSNNDAAANKGLKSISCPYTHTYLDMMQVAENAALVDEPYRGGWNDGMVTTLERTYSLDPNYKTKGREEYCVGVQANMWTETTNDDEELEYQVFPRLLAASEISWLSHSEKDWNSFYKRLQSHDEILDACGITYAKHYIAPKKLTENEALVAEAEEILAQSIRGGVGYPEAEVYDALKAAAGLAKGDEAQTEELKKAVKAYKTAKIVQPEAGKMYQIFSASTYYKLQFAGSSLYHGNGGLRIHYTPQVEPEELWEFVVVDGKMYLQNVGSKQRVALNVKNKPVVMDETGTAIRVDKATKATRDITYVPGAVTISAVTGYSPNVTGNVKRLVAQVSGAVNVADEAALCYPGTWKMVEVTDFKAQLEGLCRKCEVFFRQDDPKKVGAPTAEALTFLKDQVWTPAQEALKGAVTEAMYLDFLALYKEFLAMPRTNVIDALDESVYYRIQNVYFSNFYAAINGQNVAVKRLNESDDQFLWQICKNDDGSITLKNKRNNKFAYYKQATEKAPVRYQFGTENASWIPEFIQTDQNQSGIALTDMGGTYSWYAWADGNTAVANVDLRPKDWGASIWNFIPTKQVVTGLEAVEAAPEGEAVFYDLSGRKVNEPAEGVFVKDNGEKTLVR